MIYSHIENLSIAKLVQQIPNEATVIIFYSFHLHNITLIVIFSVRVFTCKHVDVLSFTSVLNCANP